MKKVYSLLTVLTLFMFPLAVFADVNITITDTSVEESNSISVTIDTETDTLEKVALPIRYSEGVSITGVTPGSVDCSSLDYTESTEENTVVILCELDTATALDGVLANISFTSTEDDYTFEIFESEEFDLGGLFLGETVNLQTDIDTQLEDSDYIMDDTSEGDFMVTSEESAPSQKEDFIDTITEYLPYILIGGSVILLISIVAILLGKKKGPKAPNTGEQQVESTSSIATTKEGGEPSLKDMVNNPNVAPVQQETPLQQSPVMTPPPPEQEFVPSVSSASEEEDLQEILQREVNTPQQEVPIPEQQSQQPIQTESTPISTGFTPIPETPESIMPEMPTPEAQTVPTESPVDIDPNLQANIDTQIDQIGDAIETPAMNQETQVQVPPVSSEAPEDLTGDLPPVPPPTM